MGKFEDLIATYSDVKKASDDMFLARNKPDEFYRILRRRFEGGNANVETFDNRVLVSYTREVVTPETQKAFIDRLKADPAYRYSPKSDRDKSAPNANISDAPGFGSVRNSPPFEDPNFDREYFEFVNNLVEDGDNVIDFGGGLSPFLSLIEHGNRILVDKANIPDVVNPLGIQYVDGDEWFAAEKQQEKHSGVLFCYHTLEHLNNPEEMIRLMSKFDVFAFATPNEELIETSIYHNVLMQLDVFKKIFAEQGSVAFLRLSKGRPLDIHGIVVNSPKKWAYMKNNLFFTRNFKLYKEL